MKRAKSKRDWPLRRLGDSTTVLSGATPKTSVVEYWNGEMVWLTPKDLGALESIEVCKSERRITQQGFDSCSAQLIPPNSVVMSSRAPIGHLAINSVPVCTNQGCKSLVPRSELDTRFLYWALRGVMPEIQHLGDGCTFDEVSKTDLEAFEIPVPPLAEQQRLVACIEALTSRLEQARQARQSAIAEAENVILSATQAVFAPEATEDWEELPFTEAMKRVQPRGGKLKTAEYRDEGAVPIVDQGQALICGYTEDLARKFQGPLPVIIFGDHTRNVKFVDFDFAVGADGTVLMHANERIEPRFFYHWLCSVELHNLGYSRHFKLLAETTVRFPPDRAEQRRIVTRLDALAAKQTELRRLQAQTESELAAFTPALLAKAFRGEL
jgi:type I restriction enzyme S subunit